MKTVQLLLIFLAACSLPAGASNKVDSLKQILQNHAASDKAEVLWAIAYELFDVDNPQALFYAERAYQEVWAKGDSLQIVKVGTTYGQLLRRVGDLHRSIEVSSGLLPIARRHDFRSYVKKLLNSLEVAHVYAENYGKAVELAYESLTIRQQDGDRSEIAIGLANLGVVFFQLGDYEESIAKSKEVLELLDSSRMEATRINAVQNIGASLFELRRFEEAGVWFKKALGLDPETDQMLRPQVLQMYAHTLYKLGRYDSSRHYAKTAKVLAQKASHHWPLVISCMILTDLALIDNNLIEAGKQLRFADSVLSEISYAQLNCQVMLRKGRYFARLGNPIESANQYELHNEVKDSLDMLRRVSVIRELHVAHAQRENELKIKAQANVMELQKESITMHKKYVAVVTVLLFFVGILAVLLYRAFKRKKAISQILDERVVERTKELGIERDTLQHFIDQERFKRSRFSSELNSTLSTLEGLIHLVTIDKSDLLTIHTNRASELIARAKQSLRKLN